MILWFYLNHGEFVGFTISAVLKPACSVYSAFIPHALSAVFPSEPHGVRHAWLYFDCGTDEETEDVRKTMCNSWR